MKAFRIPPISMSEAEIGQEINEFQRMIDTLKNTLAERQHPDVLKYGYPIGDGLWAVFDTAPEAYKQAGIYFGDAESGPYRVQKVYI
jgi:hypothetical protein